jgi:hypothetical protein
MLYLVNMKRLFPVQIIFIPVLLLYCGQQSNPLHNPTVQSSFLEITAVSDSAISLRWSSADSAGFSSYRICCSTVHDTLLLSHTIDSVMNRADTVYTVRHLVPLTRYYVQVAAYAHQTFSARSNIVDTTTDSSINKKITIDTSVEIIAVSDSAISLRWSSANPAGFSSYKIYCSTVHDTSLQAYPVDSVMNRTDTVYTIRHLVPLTHYYVQVATFTNQVLSVISIVLDMTTDSTVISIDTPVVFQFRPMPGKLNPVLSLFGGLPGLIKTNDAVLKGTVALFGGQISDENRNRINDTNIKAIYPRNPSLPFSKDTLDSIFSKLSVIKAGNGKNNAAPLVWKSVLTFSGDYSLETKNYYKQLIVCHGTLTLPLNSSFASCMILSDKKVIVSGNSTGCIFDADSGIAIENGSQEAQFFSHGVISTSRSASFSPSNTLISRTTLDSSKQTLFGGIWIDSQSNIKGTIICYGDFPVNTPDNNYVSIGDGTTMEGTVITDKPIIIRRCTIIGHMWCHLIRNYYPYTGASSLYMNFLWGMTVLPPDPEYEFPILGIPFIQAGDLFGGSL